MSYNLTGAAQGGNFVLTRSGGATANLTGLAGGIVTAVLALLTFVNQGKLFYRATTTAAVPTVDVNTGLVFKTQAANTVATYLFGTNAAGTVGVAQGLIVPWTDTSAGSTRAPLPILPDAYTPLGYAVIKNGATGTAFVFGTSFWNQTGVVIDTPVDLFSVTATDPVTA